VDGGCAISRLEPRRIALINEKGGSAKTTLVANLGAYLAAQCGRRVLAIDMDPQGQLGKVLGVEPRRAQRNAIELLVDTVLGTTPPLHAHTDASLPITPSRVANLDLVVATKELGLAPAFERDDPDPTGRLRRRLDAAAALRRYDYVLVDAPPSFGLLTLNVLRAVDEVVVPVPLTFLALDGCAELERTLAAVRSRYGHPGLRIAMVVPTFHRRTRMAEEVLGALRARFPKEISHTVVGFHVKIDEAQSRGKSVFEYAPKDRGARALAALAQELEARAPLGEGPP
jgi:chromosome partitioning protein